MKDKKNDTQLINHAFLAGSILLLISGTAEFLESEAATETANAILWLVWSAVCFGSMLYLWKMEDK